MNKYNKNYKHYRSSNDNWDRAIIIIVEIFIISIISKN